jgi:hypothetical protein
LERLSQSQRAALFLDRRLDPTTPHDFSAQGKSLQSVFQMAADVAGGGACRIGDMIYVGPPDVAAALPDLLAQMRQNVRKLPEAARKTWQRAQPWQFTRLAQPAQQLNDLAEANQIALANVENIQHDLWPAMDLPPLSLAERLACVLVGFGQWIEIAPDGRSAQIVPLELPLIVTRTYASPPKASLSRWLEANLPEAKFERRSGGLSVAASPRDHHRIACWLATNDEAPPAAVDAQIKVVSLKATASAGGIARQVATQLGIEFVCPKDLESYLEKQVAVDVERVSYDELLTRVFADTGLSFELDQRQLRVFARLP